MDVLHFAVQNYMTRVHFCIMNVLCVEMIKLDEQLAVSTLQVQTSLHLINYLDATYYTTTSPPNSSYTRGFVTHCKHSCVCVWGGGDNTAVVCMPSLEPLRQT